MLVDIKKQIRDWDIKNKFKEKSSAPTPYEFK